MWSRDGSLDLLVHPNDSGGVIAAHAANSADVFKCGVEFMGFEDRAHQPAGVFSGEVDAVLSRWVPSGTSRYVVDDMG